MVGTPALDERNGACKRGAAAGAEFLGEAFAVGSLRRGHGMVYNAGVVQARGFAALYPHHFGFENPLDYC